MTITYYETLQANVTQHLHSLRLAQRTMTPETPPQAKTRRVASRRKGSKGGRQPGFTHSAETRRRMSIAQKARQARLRKERG